MADPQNDTTPPLKAPKNELNPLKAPTSELKPLDQNIELKRKWYALSPVERMNKIHSMSPEELDAHYNALGTFGQGPISISKAPEFTGFGFRKVDIPLIGKQTQFAPTPESVQWMKNKARGFLNWGQENLSNLAGPIGAHLGKIGGAAVGEAINPEVGAVIGGTAGEPIGAGIAGGMAEAVRQGLEHLEGVDKYNEPWENTWGERARRITRAGAGQAAAQIIGMGTGEILRPTLKKSISNLYEAGLFKYGDPLAEKVMVGSGKEAYKSGGTLEKVVNDVMDAEKGSAKAGKPAVTIRGLYDNLESLNKDIGKQVDEKMLLPIRQGGKLVPLKDATPDPTPLVDLIKSFEKKDVGIVKRASLVGNDPRILSAQKYQRMVKDRALTFEQEPWTYGQLAKERIDINTELSDYYGLSKDGKRDFLNAHPLFEVDKAIADYIRKVTYPEMDAVANLPKGTTAELQGKRGALIDLQNQLFNRMENLYTEARTGTEKGPNIGAYATPSGIGAALHRLPIKLPSTVEEVANRKVSRAFGHTFESKLRKWTTSPGGSDVLGDNIWSLPVRYLIYRRKGDDIFSTRPTPKPPADQDENGPQSSVSTPKELMQRAKDLNPAAQGQTAYNHVAVNPATGHRIASRNGVDWVDANTGEIVS